MFTVCIVNDWFVFIIVQVLMMPGIQPS